MSDFRRYAVYYLPDDAELAAFGAAWLGWDITTGRPCAQPDVPGIERITATPRKYGFHGTLKPPFRLSAGQSFDNLASAVASFASATEALRLDGLKLALLGKFLALIPEGGTGDLSRFAFQAVKDLDAFRAPPSEAELARRRASGLTERQDALLEQWGYPYVAEEFRFHLTLSSQLEADDLETAQSALAEHLPALPAPFEIRSVALVGEDAEGMFHLIHRYALTG